MLDRAYTLRLVVALSGCFALQACDTPSQQYRPDLTYGGSYPPPPGPPAWTTRAQGAAIVDELRRSQAEVQSLAQDIAKLRHDLCVVGAKTALVEIRRDPVSGHNRVLASDGPIPNPGACPP